jgi:hypothetical protein
MQIEDMNIDGEPVKKLSKDEIQQIVERAVNAAQHRAIKMIDENPGVWYPCGFAWVRIRPARGPLIAVLKEMGIGKTAMDGEGGWMVWNPSNHPTQWMDAKYQGAQEFAKILRSYGFRAEADCRMD